MASDPVFFELSWSALSIIGAANVFFGVLVVSVTSFSPIAAVPIVTSVACAFANGLCYHAFYLTSQPVTNRAVASGFADILWLIQEAGLSMYSYAILSRILRDKKWHIFAGLFWTIMVGIVAVRIAIAVTRVRLIVVDDSGLQNTVNYLHMAYFPLIAVIECVSAYYLLTTFAKARTSCFQRHSKMGLFQYLMRSTEVRLALLAVVGTMRAVTYSFQITAQSATNLASQIDRFCYTMECLFPMIMYIDMLSSKIVHTNQQQNISMGSSWEAHSAHGRQLASGKDRRAEHVVEIHTLPPADSRYGGMGSESQQRIVDADSIGMAISDIELPAIIPCR